MNILFVTPRYYPHIGGVEYIVKSVAERLVRRGYNVLVLCGDPGIENPVDELINGVYVYRWPTTSPRGAYHFPRMRSKLERELLELARSVDVVHVHSVHSVFTMYSLRVLSSRSMYRVVTTHYHGTGHTLFRRLLWIPWRLYVKRLLTHCMVHAVSRYEASLIERDFKVKPVVIEHGVEEWIREVDWKPEDYVLYSGRIERYKNIELLATIVKKLNEHYDCNLKLRVQGRGPHREKLLKTLRKLGIQFEVEDFKPYREYIETLSRARLFGLLSEKEAFGQSINEANTIGVPAVVAKPWGLNFEGRRRTLIVDLNQDINTLVKTIYDFMNKAPLEEKSTVPTWSEVVDKYIKELYNTRHSVV